MSFKVDRFFGKPKLDVSSLWEQSGDSFLGGILASYLMISISYMGWVKGFEPSAPRSTA